MTVSPKALEGYKAIYRKNFGKDISDADALEQATKLLRLMEIVYKPMTEEEYNEIAKRNEKIMETDDTLEKEKLDAKDLLSRAKPTPEQKQKIDEMAVEMTDNLNKNVEESVAGDEVPQIIKEVGFDFNWSEEKVWALNIPTEEMPIADLTWHFDIPFLWEKGVYDLKPQEVLDDPEAHKEEYERTMRADLVHPIDIMENKGRWLILDGLHRLMKASALGMKTVKVRKVPRELIPEIVK